MIVNHLQFQNIAPKTMASDKQLEDDSVVVISLNARQKRGERSSN